MSHFIKAMSSLLVETECGDDTYVNHFTNNV